MVSKYAGQFRSWAMSPLIGVFLVGLVGIYLAREYNYKFFDSTKVFDMGREFDRSSLAVSAWLRDKAEQGVALNVNFLGPTGSLLTYYTKPVPNIATTNIAGENWTTWNTLLPIPHEMCAGARQLGIHALADQIYGSGEGFSFAPKKAFKAEVSKLCRLEGSTLAFMWVQKSRRYRNFDCYNRKPNEQVPPTYGSCNLNLQTQESLLDKTKKGDFLVVESRYYFLTDFFDAHPAFQELIEKDFGEQDRAKVYEVIEHELNVLEAFNVRVSEHISAFLSGFRDANADRYRRFEQNVLKHVFKLNASKIDAEILNPDKCFRIENRDYAVFGECVRRWKKRY